MVVTLPLCSTSLPTVVLIKSFLCYQFHLWVLQYTVISLTTKYVYTKHVLLLHTSLF